MDQNSLVGQVLLAVLAVFATGGAGTQVIGLLRKRRAGAPLTETAARVDIVQQLAAERVARATVEHERDAANSAAARAGRERDAADRRAEAADRRANSAQREADVWERYAAELREDCLGHGTPIATLRPRPTFVGAAP